MIHLLFLSSDCDLVCLGYIPVALVTSLETIFSLSSPYLSPFFSSLYSSSSGLYSSSSPSYIQSPSFLSISPIVLSTIEPSFNPSIVPSSISVLHVIFTSYCLLFLQFSTESFLFDSYDHIHDHGIVMFSRI